ncbi:hypothetical conserved protein [Candidatus Nitrosoglobus terrae]|uniref:Hypothetical conserved protein n=1 Tax=Candidatus Nitrosoglobus terrae TaxID=1630141 RepID=A0A1Q2SM29_9GAMM|nr:DUF3570 domain-containing protein [Candidatus Nitrosoglobus terrae]BAW80173.1 hypothetical conserved protein [Candidatus Nitrosoglobus terrae]
MAVIKPISVVKRFNRQGSSSLLALTSAALALPGLIIPSAQAEPDIDEGPFDLAQDNSIFSSVEGGRFGFQYGRYQEGGGNLNAFRPQANTVRADTLHAFGEIDLTDRLTFRGNFIQDTWSGATSISTAPAALTRFNPNAETGASAFTNLRGGVVNFNTETGQGLALIPGTDKTILTNQVVHMMAVASPETRKQGDFGLTHEWDDSTLEFGGGISQERDFDSMYFRLRGTADFNQKLTTLTWGVNYANNAITVQRYPFRLNSAAVDLVTLSNPDFPDWSPTVNTTRNDYSINLGVNQVLDKDSIFTAQFIYTNNSGYQSDPYKEAVFVVPLDTPGQAWSYDRYDKRPNERNQFTWALGYSRYFDKVNGALKLNYNFFHDTWEIDAHTFGASWAQSLGHGWTLTPNIRYYSQSAASFYKPFFIGSQTPISLAQALNNQSTLPTPQFFSSDYRLSAFGTLSGGLTVNKEFSRGIDIGANFEYFDHANALTLGGGGSGSFGDFHYYVASAFMNVNLSSAFNSISSGGKHAHQDHNNHGEHTLAPAGVLFSHMMDTPGQFMVGLRYFYNHQGGDTIHGTQPVDNTAIINNACNGSQGFTCQMKATYMNMAMEMLDIMYAPTSWLNLMVMPMFMDMHMDMPDMPGAPQAVQGQTMIMSNGPKKMSTGGVADTRLVALVKLFDSPFDITSSAPRHHFHIGLGVSAPTGDSGLRSPTQETDPNSPFFGKPLFKEYDMQLGSGTWDFIPSLTYTGVLDRWSWGGQLNGTVRTQRNSSGYALGDIFQATAWGGYNVLHWLSFTLRGLYTTEGKIRGQFKQTLPAIGTMPSDWPQNYGSRTWDVGFGVNAVVPSGKLQGNRFGVEWLQPTYNDVNGYQLEQKGELIAWWNYTF